MLSFLYSPTLTSIHDYWKTIALTRRTFVGKITSLLFTMLSRFVVAFIPRRRRVASLEKTLMLGEIEGDRRRGQQRMRWLGGITDSMDMNEFE